MASELDRTRRLAEDSWHEFAADDADRKEREAERLTADPPAEPPPPVPSAGGFQGRLQTLLELIFGHGPLLLIAVFVALILVFVAVMGSRGRGSGEPSQPSPGQSAATAVVPGADPDTAAGSTIPAGTYTGVFTDDIGDTGRIWEKGAKGETGRSELANEVVLTVATDGVVSGAFNWHGELYLATDFCTAVKDSEHFGTLEGVADEAGHVTGSALISDRGSSTATCHGEVAPPVTWDHPENGLFPFTASVVDGHVEGEITDIFAFTADLGG